MSSKQQTQNTFKRWHPMRMQELGGQLFKKIHRRAWGVFPQDQNLFAPLGSLAGVYFRQVVLR